MMNDAITTIKSAMMRTAAINKMINIFNYPSRCLRCTKSTAKTKSTVKRTAPEIIANMKQRIIRMSFAAAIGLESY
jgi:hypothetical protein